MCSRKTTPCWAIPPAAIWPVCSPATNWATSTMGYPSPALSRALEKHHVPCKEVLFPNATHGVGTGAGTDADGWMLDAANFWETQING